MGDLVTVHKRKSVELIKTLFPQKAVELDVLLRSDRFSLATLDALLATTRQVTTAQFHLPLSA